MKSEIRYLKFEVFLLRQLSTTGHPASHAEAFYPLPRLG